MPEQSTKPKWTRAQLDDDIKMLTASLSDWDREQDLRLRLDACNAATDNLWDNLAETNTRALQAQAAYFADPNPERNHSALLDFQASTHDLIPIQIAYHIASKTQRALRLEWDAFWEGNAQARREDLLAKLEYVRGLTPLEESDAPGWAPQDK